MRRYILSRRRLSGLALAVYLYLADPKIVCAEDHLSVKWQDYKEDMDRIRVLSRYVGFEKQLNAQLTLKGYGVHDSISGATPTGNIKSVLKETGAQDSIAEDLLEEDSFSGATPTGFPEEDEAPPPLPPVEDDGEEGELIPVFSQMEDTRNAGVIDLQWEHGIHTSTFEFSYSSENDFLSRGYAYSQTSEFNKRNTGLSYGISYVDDDVFPSFFTETREKGSYDHFIGISQVVDPNTTIALNFTYGDYSGYLNDPYKVVRKKTEVSEGVFLPLTFEENRPADRTRRIWFLNVKRFFPSLGASIDMDYRYFNDTWGIESHTFDFEWYQKIGQKLTLRPKYRHYSQSAANFYTLDLSGTSIDPSESTLGYAPHYSADYRLAKFDSHTYGIKALLKLSEKYTIDATFERYEMEGKDDTPQLSFPEADIVSLGASLWF